MSGREHEAERPGWPDSTAGWMARDQRLLTACAWCLRINVNERWVSADVAIRELRTYDWSEPPLFTHGLCDHCWGFVSAGQPLPGSDVLPSQAVQGDGTTASAP